MSTRPPETDRRPITAKRSIAAPQAAVWEVIAAPGQLQECHPFCSANPAQAWPGKDSRDTVEYYNGRVIERRFTTWTDGEGYDLKVSDANGPSASVSWRITPDGANSTLTICLTPRFLGGIPSMARRAVSAAIVRPMMRRYLRSVLRGIEWRVTTGNPVHRNQFGSHPWFSHRS